MDARIAVDRRDLKVLASVFARVDAPREDITYQQFRATMLNVGFTTLPAFPFVLFRPEAHAELQSGSLLYNPDHAGEDELIPEQERSRLAYILAEVWHFNLDRFYVPLSRKFAYIVGDVWQSVLDHFYGSLPRA